MLNICNRKVNIIFPYIVIVRGPEDPLIDIMYGRTILKCNRIRTLREICGLLTLYFFCPASKCLDATVLMPYLSLPYVYKRTAGNDLYSTAGSVLLCSNTSLSITS